MAKNEILSGGPLDGQMVDTLDGFELKQHRQRIDFKTATSEKAVVVYTRSKLDGRLTYDRLIPIIPE